MNKKDIVALVEGRLSEERKREVITWLLKNPRKQKTYHKLKARHVSRMLREAGNGPAGKEGRSHSRSLWFLKIAAVFLVFMALSYVLVSRSFNTAEVLDFTILLTTTSIGEKKAVVLEDGTRIILNANTILSYPKVFSGKTREVTLQGEAFFDVSHDPKKPFVVHTDNGMKIRVLGTKFNVKSYSEDFNIETTLVSGKVRVVEEKDNKSVVLNPSQRATYVKNEDKLIIDNVSTDNLTAWRQGKLVYDETPIRQVISDLKRTYNVSIEVRSEEIMDYNYTGVFDKLSIEQIMDLFEVSSPILYEMNNNQIILYMEK
jgi:ferric-dicitrate binding protein FerR (iron transport regulator)